MSWNILEVNITEVKPGKFVYKYLLAFVDTFSGWVEAFSTKQGTVTVVAKKIVEEIFPMFKVPKVIGSDNGPASVSKVSQGLAEILGIIGSSIFCIIPRARGR